ncbi:MAG: VanZ family protein [Sphingobacteriales bacterium]|nr:MAG: VanZ family protein [Sphingobacteriales bacterium]
MVKHLKSQLPSILWALLVFTLCNMPINNMGNTFSYFEGFDKLVHLGFFFVLAVLIFWGRINSLKNYHLISDLTIAVLVTFCFGSGIELLQWKVFTYRSGDWWDLFADMLGVAMAIFAYILLHKKQDFITLKTKLLQ